MRLIDADALKVKIVTLDRVARSAPQKALLGRVLYITEQMPTVGGWISVKDRLPEKGERVLILSRYGHISDAELHEHGGGLMVFDPLGYVVGEHVKYWMPLQEPPKEGD